ncbi:MAG: hypothetical protein K8F62_11695 [Pseudorhodoplanes sp.]|nr:hypothetical protein [Pseudorhodoplanes sp.]
MSCEAAGGLYAAFMRRPHNPHRTFIRGTLGPCPNRIPERTMLDLIFLAIGIGFFVLSIAYVYACDRL